MLDEAITLMVKEIHPRLTAKAWVGDYYAMWGGEMASRTTLSSFWEPVRIELNRPDWYRNLATSKRGDHYELLPEHAITVRVIDEITKLINDIVAIDDQIIECTHTAMKADGRHKMIELHARVNKPRYQGFWRKRIFLDCDECPHHDVADRELSAE